MQGHQVLEVHAQNRQPEARAAGPGAAVARVVVAGGEELRQLQQGLCGRNMLWEARLYSLSPPRLQTPRDPWKPPEPLLHPTLASVFPQAAFPLGTPTRKGSTITPFPKLE